MAAADNFKIWQTRGETAARGVVLKGQFDAEQERKAEIGGPQWLANPVTVNKRPPEQKAWHLSGYRIAPSNAPGRTVTLTNEFETGVVWELGAPALLLVPAAKGVGDENPGKPPAGLDHWECYTVTGARTIEPRLTLEDQFDALLGRPEVIKLLRPVLFGVPVSKDQEPIPDPTTHLAIYELEPRTEANPGKRIVATVVDQFGSHRLEPAESFFFAVASEKLKWAPRN